MAALNALPSSAGAPLTLFLLGAKPGVTVEVAPGRKIELRDADPLPRHCMAELVPLGGGTYRVIPRPLTEWMGLSEAALKKLGLTLSENTLRRLGRAGFIRMRQVSPNRYEFNYESWLEHCRKVEANPEEFWEQRPIPNGPTNREKYLAAL